MRAQVRGMSSGFGSTSSRVEIAYHFGLEGIGLDLWQLIQSPRTVSEIIQYLTSHYEVEPEVCKSTTLGFLDQLVQHDLLLVQKHAVTA